MGKVEDRLKEMGYSLPEVPTPLAAYVPGVKLGNLIFTSGQVAIADGKLVYKGVLGQDVDVETGYKAAELCALNALAVVKSLVGDLDKVKRVVKLTGYVNSTVEFGDQPKVMNGASNLLVELFGEQGKHARAAVGSSGLPLGSAVELDLLVEVEE